MHFFHGSAVTLFCCFSHVWLSATPWTVAHQAPLSVGFCRHEYCSGLLFPSLGDLPDPGIEPESPASPVLQADSLPVSHWGSPFHRSSAGAAKSLQSCPTLRNPVDSSPPDSPVPGILQARTLEWVAISFSNAWKWKMEVKLLSHIWLSDPMDCSLPGSSVRGIFQARVLEWIAFAFSFTDLLPSYNRNDNIIH